MRTDNRPRLLAAAGYSLVELIISMGLLTLVMGVTMSGLANVMKGNEVVMAIASMNNSARSGMDLIIRDLLQVGSGLPASHAISIPNGAGSTQVRLPGPPGIATYQVVNGTLTLPALIPHAGQGKTINNVSTDVLSMLMADNTFLDMRISAFSNTDVTFPVGTILDEGPDRVVEGQLMLIKKGSYNTLVQVTFVDGANRKLKFDNGDSLRLNQSAAAFGTLRYLNTQDPLDKASTPTVNEATAAMTLSRMRMITYYLDDEANPQHPRLVRRVNNGHPTLFDNELGTAVVADAVDLQFTFDISNGTGNPGGVEMVPNDLTTGGACSPARCSETQIRKVNVKLTAQTPNPNSLTSNFLSNTLESQVSLRAMAFVDRYR